jgi:hypothetical protein
MSQTIVLDDLAFPKHTPEAQEILALVEDVPVEISVEAVLAQAREQSDVPLYEDTEFVSRMAEYIAEVQLDTHLSQMGKITISSFMVNAVVQRSRLEALYLEHPEIEEVEIVRPLIIAGLPRSGTTNMLNLLAADTRLRSLRYWESLEPIPSRSTLSGEGSDDRYDNCVAQLATVNSMMPLFSSMHDLTPESIHEEVELQWLDFGSMLCGLVVDVPNWFEWYLKNRRQEHYDFLKRVLKALQWLRGPEQWVLKSPAHLGFLPELVQTFPDATFVVTHRDPVSIFTSWVTMNAYTNRMRCQNVNLEDVVKHSRMIQDCLLQGLVRDVSVLPPAQTKHVFFHEYMADNMGVLGEIYDLAGIGLDQNTRASIEKYIKDHPRGRAGKVKYDLEGQFGIKRDDLYQEFSYYMDAFPVRREDENT